jgi:twitching motility protein PilT
MVPAVEVMVMTQRIREMIEDPQRTKEISEAIQAGRHPYGMISFDQSLVELVTKRLVTYEEALANATRPADFALTFRGFEKGTATEAVRPQQPAAPASRPTAAMPSYAPQQPPPPTARPANPKPTESRPPNALEIDRFGNK